MVQLRTPVVPSLVIRPNTAAFEPERFTPLEDARITRNTVGALKPDVLLRSAGEFDRAFTVSTSDPEFAARVFTTEVVALLTTDPWFRVREIAFHGGSLWATESGPLTQERMFVNSRQLARLAAVVPWEDEEFRSFAEETETSATGWLGPGGGGVRGWVNRRREAAGRQPVSALSLAVRTAVVVGLLVPGLSPTGNAVAALTGLAPEIRLTVTDLAEASSRSCSECGMDLVDGVYDGGSVTGMWWMSFADLPEKGDVIDVAVGPLWWNPVIERTDAAVFLLLFGLLPLLCAAGLAKATCLPRRRELGPAPAGSPRHT